MIMDKITDFLLKRWEVVVNSFNNLIDITQEEFFHCILLFMAFALLIIFCWVLIKNKVFNVLSRHLLLCSLTIWLVGVAVYVIGYFDRGLISLAIIPRAIVSSFRMFVVSHDLARIQCECRSDAIYMTFFSLVHFAAAFITFLFIFKMVGYKIRSAWKMFKYSFCRNSKDKIVHLFWGINEASCLMAEDIRKQHKDAIVILVDIDIECEDDILRKATLSNITNTITIKNSDIERLDSIDAYVDHCYNGPSALRNCKDIFGSLYLKRIGRIVKRSKQTVFYFLSDNEAQNIVGALNLQQDNMLCNMPKDKLVIYVHARRDANNEVFDHYSQYAEDSKRIKIRLVDSAYLSVTTMKQNERTWPVNCVKIDKATGLVDSPFTSLIVGFGGTGQEAFKFLYEYSAFVNSNFKRNPFKCYAIDENMDKIEGFIRRKMPAIGEDKLTLIKASADSQTFWMQINKTITDLNYVLIALNNDTLGLSLAVNVFKYALQHRSPNLPMLKIVIRCYDNSNEKRMKEVTENLNKSVEGNNVEILLFGLKNELYSCNTILHNKTMKEAKEFNCIYEGSKLSAKKQWIKSFGENELKRLIEKEKMSRYHAIYDINRRIAQNVSNSDHRRTKMILLGFANNEFVERLRLYYGYVNTRKENSIKYACSAEDEQILLNMARVEHERWIASHELMGYTYNQETDCIKKYHKCMCSWDELDEITKSYDCNVVDTTIKMAFNRDKTQNQ